jgi:murein DD-endopeptidase MepM/ murein hydrolase activator NlpD
VVAGEHPLGLAAGLNLYAYAGNDPVNGKDPLGLSACSVYVTGRLIWWSDGSVTFESWFKSVVCEETLIGLEGGAAGGGQQPQQPQPKRQGPGCPKGPTQWPVSGPHPVTSGFGPSPSRRAKGLSDPHGGLDIGVPVGTAVNPMAPGTVVGAWDSRDGLFVEVNHGGGYTSRYFHLSGFNTWVSFPANLVGLADVLGWSGWAGTGAHLHLELLHNGVRIDPRPCLP